VTDNLNGIVLMRSSVPDQLLAEARRVPELECCGLLAGRDGVISVVLPARNLLASATAYEIEPAELFALFRRIRADGLDHLGIYHSHPRGENAPSPRDVELAFYPQAACFILSPLANAALPVRAFRIVQGQVSELTLRLV
jgi:[CysO sulfur-carrier protein]-S-L-cysteine hydrolase